MASAYLDHHIALLNHLRMILGALGEAEQVPRTTTACSWNGSTN